MGHLEMHVGSTPDSLLFTAPKGSSYLQRRNFTRRVWKPATVKVGVSLHFQHATEDRDRVLADALSKLREQAEVIHLDNRRDGSGAAELG